MHRRHGIRAATATLTSIAYLTFTAVFAGGGCVSNEYRISRDELQRLAQAPLETRGAGVHVVQEMGQRRDWDVPPPSQEELRQAWEPEYVEDQPTLGFDEVDDEPIPGLHDSGSGNRSGGRVTIHPRGIRPHGGGYVGRGSLGRAPVYRGTVGGGSHANAGGGSHLFDGGGGGGGGSNDASALAVVAVVAVAIAGVVAVGLVASEGMRFQGKAAMAPQQTLYVEHDNGVTSQVTVGDLGPADLRHATGAVVKDDEGYGLALGPRDPLDRVGGAFSLELGATTFNLGHARGVGPAAEIQVGGFFRPRWGLMLDVGVSGGDVALGGAASVAASAAEEASVVTRHHVALELQAFPASLGPLHFGLFGRAGAAVVGAPEGIQGGPLAGGGALIQLELTSRMALVLRGTVDTAHIDGAWSTAGVATAGVAIY